MVFRLNNIKFVISIFIVFCCIIFHRKLNILYDKFLFNPNEQEGIYTETQLAQFDGFKKKELYLAMLGIVFDVTKGRRHYEKGSGYHYFIDYAHGVPYTDGSTWNPLPTELCKDGTRALITGEFNNESQDKDHVMDLACTELFSLLHWKNTFTSKYKKVGILVGRFYDKNGQPSTYSLEFDDKIRQCENEKEVSRQEYLRYPPCNIAWNADEGTKVWCTKSSGGIMRSWIGVPRQLYTPGEERPRCVCVNTNDESHSSLLKEYNKCPNTSTLCIINK